MLRDGKVTGLVCGHSENLSKVQDLGGGDSAFQTISLSVVI